MSDSKEIPVIPHLRRVVDMSEINQQSRNRPSSKPAKKPVHAKNDTVQSQDKPSPKRHRAPAASAAPTTPDHPNAPQPENLRPSLERNTENHDVETRVRPQPPKRTKAPTFTAPSSVYEAKTTRLVAPPKPIAPPAQPAVSVPQETTNEPAAAATEPVVKVDSSASKPKTRKITEFVAQRREKRVNSSPKLIARQARIEAEAKRQASLRKCLDEELLLQSWRAKKWSECIGALDPCMPERLQKCMPLVQSRLVNNIFIERGILEATVVDQVVSVEVEPIEEKVWRKIINQLSDRAIFTTSLLNGELPEGILDIFEQEKRSLFPKKLNDFLFTCDCGAEQMPCKHVCALLLTFALSLEENPFHILTFRGMSRDNLISQLRDARSDQVVNEKTSHRLNYEMPAKNINVNAFYSSSGKFSDLNFHVSFSRNPILKRLGNPGAWQAGISIEDAIEPIIQQAAMSAENLGVEEMAQEALDQPELPEQPPAPSRFPKKSIKGPRFKMPDLHFITEVLSPEILETVKDDPVTTAEAIIQWLKSCGASDIRTLARRTRLKKPTIEAFMNAFCEAGLTRATGEPEKQKFEITF